MQPPTAGTWDVILDAEFGQEEITVKTKYLEPLDELESVLYEMDEEVGLQMAADQRDIPLVRFGCAICCRAPHHCSLPKLA